MLKVFALKVTEFRILGTTLCMTERERPMFYHRVDSLLQDPRIEITVIQDKVEANFR